MVSAGSQPTLHQVTHILGWGGCVVALTTKDTVESYIKMLKESFYETNSTTKGKDLNMFVFATEPSGGAQIIVRHI
ncbi:unnamed protein product [Timema podura]|uniref:Uncharacterized protein n=1 Tax=Timema podura TaxID=61482 RepID=A0ABN7NY63_TIMPD|nr:unnamed protein product [Timema podura]